MKEKPIQASFQARREGLLIQTVDDELLVYDLARHKAHCLNRASAAVWKHCDGNKSVDELASAASRELHIAFDDQMVWLAIRQLDHARLLEERLTTGAPKISRREIIKRAGLAAAVSVPLISSIMSPTPAQAATCVAKGGACTSSLQCCSRVCNTGTGKCL